MLWEYYDCRFCEDDLAAVCQEEDNEEANVKKSKRVSNGESSGEPATSSHIVEKRMQPQCLICMVRAAIQAVWDKEFNCQSSGQSLHGNSFDELRQGLGLVAIGRNIPVTQ